MELGISPNELDAVLITHEHSDHVNGVRVLSKKFNIPVYATEKTLGAMNLYDVYAHNQRAVKSGERFEIREFEIFPFSIPHDAADPVGYSVLAENKRYTVATDLGHINERLLKCLCKSEVVLLESNHDVEMLKKGRYSYPLKSVFCPIPGIFQTKTRRGRRHSLQCGERAKIILGHLSNENNTPSLAYEASHSMLCKNGAQIGGDVILKVAPRSGILEI